MSGSTTNGQHGSTRHHAHFLLTAVESAKDPDIGKRLWRVSEELTGVQFDIPLDGGRSTARLGQKLLGHNC
jgi:hypothetical protein